MPSPLRWPLHSMPLRRARVSIGILHILCVAVGGGAEGGLRILGCGYLRCVALIVDMRVQLRLVPTYSSIVLGIGMLCCFQSQCLHSSGGMRIAGRLVCVYVCVCVCVCVCVFMNNE